MQILKSSNIFQHYKLKQTPKKPLIPLKADSVEFGTTYKPSTKDGIVLPHFTTIREMDLFDKLPQLISEELGQDLLAKGLTVVMDGNSDGTLAYYFIIKMIDELGGKQVSNLKVISRDLGDEVIKQAQKGTISLSSSSYEGATSDLENFSKHVKHVNFQDFFTPLPDQTVATPNHTVFSVNQALKDKVSFKVANLNELESFTDSEVAEALKEPTVVFAQNLWYALEKGFVYSRDAAWSPTEESGKSITLKKELASKYAKYLKPGSLLVLGDFDTYNNSVAKKVAVTRFDYSKVHNLTDITPILTEKGYFEPVNETAPLNKVFRRTSEPYKN